MCNCKGWDIEFHPNDVITPTPHFCRVYGDCGSKDITLDEAVEKIIKEYEIRRDYILCKDIDEYSHLEIGNIEKEISLWKSKTHLVYKFYKEQEANV